MSNVSMFSLENTPPPCGDVKNCSELPDGGYPRLDDECKSFFTCIGGLDYGTQLCNPGRFLTVNHPKLMTT